MTSSSTNCLCDSGQPYSGCCQPYHFGKALAETPEALMRSRYVAYAKGLVDYIMKTTHVDHPQYDKNPRRWRLGLAQYCKETVFERLVILDAQEASDTEGWVSFEAIFSMGGEACRMSEKSQFQKVDGRWLYYAGESEISNV